MDQLKIPDMYTCQLLKLYRNKLPAYFENFLPEYGDSQHNLPNNCIRLPAIRCEFGKLNAKYQMHFRLRELANPSNPPLNPNIKIDNDVVAIAFSTIAITHLYIISIQIAIMSIVKPCLHITMK